MYKNYILKQTIADNDICQSADIISEPEKQNTYLLIIFK